VNYSEIRTERAYVCDQYKTKDNLQIRIQTHERFTQPKVDFHEWILDHVDWNGRETVLDVGCGSGMYVEATSERCLRYIGGDLSYGMLQGLAAPLPERVNLDAESIPFCTGSIDVVLANHMLYHVQELDKALENIDRILKPNGILIAATNSQNYMPELTDLEVGLAERFGVGRSDQWESLDKMIVPFSLENGGQALESFFAHIERFALPGALVFKESKPLIDYLASMRKRYELLVPPGIAWIDVTEILRDEIDKHIVENGEFRVHKLAGVFVCRKKR